MAGLCDFHIHSCFSDGSLAIPQIVDEFGQRGFKAIAITDHLCEEKTFLGRSAQMMLKTLNRTTFDSYMKEIKNEAARALQEYDMHVIPGFEITKNSFSHKNSTHIIALNVESYISPDDSIENICENIRTSGGLSIAAHPVDTGKFEHQTLHLWSRRFELRDYFDAWEVATGSRFYHQVAESGLALIASSDMHHKHQINSWKTYVEDTSSTNTITSCIKEQKLHVEYYGKKNLFTKFKPNLAY